MRIEKIIKYFNKYYENCVSYIKKDLFLFKFL